MRLIPHIATPNPNDILANWALERATAAEREDARVHMLAIRPQLAAVIAENHAQLASPGRTGAFSAWLRDMRIPHRQAYRLLARYAASDDAGVAAAKATVSNELNYDSGKDSDPRSAPVLILKTRVASFRLTPLGAAIINTRLDASLLDPKCWVGSRTPCNVGDTIVLAFVNAVKDKQARQNLLAIWNTPDAHQALISPFLPRLIIRPVPAKNPLTRLWNFATGQRSAATDPSPPA